MLIGSYCNFKKQKITYQLISIPEYMFKLVIFPNDSKTLNLITGMDIRNFSSLRSIAAICLLFALVVIFGCLFSLFFMAKTGAGWGFFFACLLVGFL